MIIELDGNGHRYSYVKAIAERAVERGRGVHLIVGADWADKPGADWIRAVLTLDGVALSHCDSLAGALTLAESVKASRVVLPDADRWLRSVALARAARRIPMSMLIMRPGCEGSYVSSAGARFLVKRVLVRFYRVLGVRVFALVSALRVDPGRHELRDPVYLSPTSERFPDERIGTLDDDRFWFGLFGFIEPRKRPVDVLRSLRMSEPDGPIGIVVAGKVAPTIAEPLAREVEVCRQAGIDVRWLNDFLPDPALDYYIESVDALVVAYENEGASGLLAKAAALGTSVAAAGSHSLRSDSQTRPDLIRWSPLEDDGMRDMFRRMVSGGGRAVDPIPSPPREFAARILGD